MGQVSAQNPEQRLEGFRQSYPNQSRAVNGRPWSYRIAGRGDRPLLLLPGAELINDMEFDLVAALAPRFRILYPAYPRVEALAELADGVAALLKAEHMAPATVLGASFGGAVAQCLVRRHGDTLERLILSNTGVPIPRLARTRKIANAALAAIPWPVLRRLMARSILKLIGAPETDRAFWQGYTRDLFTRLDKADVLSNLRNQHEYHAVYRFTPQDLHSWPGKVFVIESDNDIFSPERRKALRDTYPQAPVYTFHGAGHLPAISRPDEYLEVLERFLA